MPLGLFPLAWAGEVQSWVLWKLQEAVQVVSWLHMSFFQLNNNNNNSQVAHVYHTTRPLTVFFLLLAA